MRSQLKSACLLVAMSSLTATSVTVGVGPTKSDSKAQTPMAPRISTTRQLALPEVCYAPGTPMETIQRNAARRQSLMSGLQSQGFQFSDSSRWDSTATDGGGLVQGQVTTLTWNIVPDGTFVKGFNGEPDANSNLKAFLTGIYGSEAAWVAHFQTVFDQWGALTGINYVKVTEDDGSALAGANVFPFNPGLLGVRADIRISGHFIDGDFNILAYNFFPEVGDMVIDTGDAYYSQAGGGLANGSLGFRNMLAHEHGHGLGMNHSCPISNSKLMEPFLSTAFNHAQLDDKLAGWRGYGDDKENNETSGTAGNLGSLGNGTTTVNDLSADSNSDVDFYKFTVPANKKAAVTVTPIGTTYLAGAQNGDGTCSAGSSFNALNRNDLGVELRSTDGTTILGSANAFGAGSAENIAATSLPGAGTYFVRTFAGAVNSVQGYQLQVTISDGVPATPPTVTTTAATSLTLSSATLNGSVNPNGSSTTASFDYGLTVGYGSTAAGNSPGSGSSPVAVSAAITGLTCGSTYHTRLNATNDGGTTNGNDVSFQTAPCPPTVTTNAATSLAQTTATLNGTINPNGATTNRRFEYGLTASYGTTTSDLAIGSGVAPVGVSFGATGLTCNTLYHFRAVGQNGSGTTNGGDLTFTTSPCPPTATANAAANVSPNTADLSGSITSDGGGTITERGFVFSNAGVNANPLVGDGGVTKVPVAGTTGSLSTSLSALFPSTTYAFKTFATNSAGTGYSPVTFFTTSDPPSALALVARTLSINSAAKSTLSAGTPQIWYRVQLFANRSYQVSAWPVDHEQGVDAAKLTVTVFSDNAGTVQANGVTGVSTVLEAAPNQTGDDKPFTATILPTVSGTYKIRVLRVSGGAISHSVNLMLRETTLFSPWTSRAAGFEGFIEMHNNTNAAVNVTLRGYDSTGAQQGAGLTITLQPNATDFRTASQIGVPIIFAGIVLTHDGALGAVSANITTLNGANGLSFDSPFTLRNQTVLGPPVR